MFPVTKLLLSSLLFVVSATTSASKSIDNVLQSDLRVFLYSKDLPFISYSNESSFHDAKILWTNRTNMITLEYYPEEKTFFWTTNKGELFSTIWAENEDMTTEEFNRTDKDILQKKENAKLLYSEEDWYPRSMALDEVGKKLYIADTTERSIDVFNLDGKNKATIFTDDYLIPMEIVIDPNEGLLFLYAFNFMKNKTELHRMNMDGSNSKLLIFDIGSSVEFLRDELIQFAIDRENKQLIYQENSTVTVMVDYNGNGRVPIFTGDRIAHIEVHSNRIYWAQLFSFKVLLVLVATQQAQGLSQADMKFDYTVYSCDISDKTLNESTDLCSPKKVNESLKNTYMESNFTSFPELFKIVDLASRKKFDHPCLENNGGCEDHCLPKSSGTDNKLSFGCACRVGRKLNGDGKTCSDITREDKFVNDSTAFVHEKVWLPQIYFYSTNSDYIFQEFVHSSYYPIAKTFMKKLLYDGPEVARDDYLNEKYEVNEEGELVKCEGDSKCVTLRNSTENVSKLLAYDWVSKTLYFVKLCNNSSKHNLFVLSTKYPETEIFLAQIDSPTSMAVHPYRGYLYIATYDEAKNESHIISFNTNGKDRIVLPYSNKTRIFLTVDMAQNELFWIDGSDEDPYKCLRRSDLDGGDIKLVAHEKFSRDLQLLKIYRNYVFAKAAPPSGIIYSITREGKNFYGYDYAKNIEESLKSKIVIRLKVWSTDTQYLSLENPCAVNNGGCEIFCFAVPVDDSEKLQKVCDCSDDKKLDSNGLNCL